ncbi:DUF3592 domain-containing protein [Actinosynnema sp. NPDC020468]|uniref:DUF3592 domain-containing protein n=1 Tax=Actinosynnema sp. NPDC020468 TaxID=3154488 RepID=UPI0033DF9173
MGDSRLRVGRRGFRATCLVAGLVCAVFVAGTTWSTLSPDYPWDQGELVADLVIVAVSGVVSVVAGRYARRLGGDGDVARWLPPETGGPVDPGPPRRAMRVGLRWSALWLVVWTCVAVLGGVAVAAKNREARWLLDHGARDPGVVVAVHKPSKRPVTVDVRYGSSVVTVRRTTRREYAVGDRVEVYHDPADPSRFRTADEPNPDRVLEAVGFVSVFLGWLGLTVQAVAVARWGLRFRAVSRTGWRHARARYTVEPGKARFVVRFADGGELRASGWVMSRMHDSGWTPVLVGGTGGRMVIQLEDGRAARVAARAPRSLP